MAAEAVKQGPQGPPGTDGTDGLDVYPQKAAPENGNFSAVVGQASTQIAAASGARILVELYCDHPTADVYFNTGAGAAEVGKGRVARALGPPVVIEVDAGAALKAIATEANVTVCGALV